MTSKKLDYQAIVKADFFEALKNGQIHISYQPIVSISKRYVVFAEALCRWEHPVYGNLPPLEFIPYLENNGLISQLDFFVIRKVSDYLQKRHNQGAEEISISVNLSVNTIQKLDFIEELRKITDEYSYPKRLLGFEVKEHTYINANIHAIENLQKLQESGYFTFMDDFGSGNSALNALVRLPVNYLKINVKFTLGFENNPKIGTLVTAMVRMARWLKIKFIIEGIETYEQLKFLYSLGCDLIQGYFFSPALEVKEFEHYVIEEDALPQFSMSNELNAMDVDGFFGGDKYVTKLLETVYAGVAFVEYHHNRLEAIRVNDGYYEMFGYTADSFVAISNDITQKMLPEQKEKEMAYIVEAIVSGKIIKGHISDYKRNGEPIEMDCAFNFVAGDERQAIMCITYQDVTENYKNERKIAEQTQLIARQHDELKVIYNTVPCGIYQCRFTDKLELVACNNACFELLGYDSRDEVGHFMENMTKFVHSEDIQTVYDKHIDCFTKHVKNVFDFRVIRKDGSIGWLHCELTLTRSLDGESRVQAVVTDITELIEAKNYQEANKFSSVMLSMYDEIIEGNFETGMAITRFSRKYNAKNSKESRPLTQLVDKWISQNVYPQDIEIAYKIFNYDYLSKVLDVDKSAKLVYRLKCPSGFKWNQTRAFKVDEKTYLWCHSDITKQKRLEWIEQENKLLKEEQRQKARYELIVKESQLIIFEWDEISKEFFCTDSYYGLAVSAKPISEVFYGGEINDTVHPDDWELLKEFYNKKIAGVNRASVVLRLKMIDGDYKWAEVVGSYIFEDGKAVRTIITVKLIDEEKKLQEKLKVTLDLMHDTISNMPSGMAMVEISPIGKRLVFISDNMYSIFGLKNDYRMIEGDIISDYIQFDKSQELINKSLANNSVVEARHEINLANGKTIFIRSMAKAKQDGDTIFLYCTVVDITDTVINERENLANKEVYEALLESSNLVLFDYDSQKRIMKYSYVDSDGIRNYHIINDFLEELANSSFFPNMSRGKNINLFKEFLFEAKEGMHYVQADFDLRKSYKWYRVTFKSVTDEKGNIFRVIGKAELAEDEVKASQQIKVQATYDYITKLYNRISTEQLINEKLKELPRYGKVDVFLEFDIDNFKSVNDNHGHITGDKFLENVGEGINMCFARFPVRGRLSGDEFGVYLDRVESIDEAKKLAECILMNIPELAKRMELKAPVSASIGLVEAQAGDTFMTLFKKADYALYEAKKSGKNRITVYQEKPKSGMKV